ncbi:mannose-1-phosphate guanylyltransferase [Nitritalea halalkaliphila]|uniref:mannose-1-phosphate guanylyltransferase n=1 Tax=Nitritalea halalkaliphila TaxID=590849 RepID=UPI002934BAD4|nr:mannose-1-phosphate guanylyltransferase [Nitritalea halalkaliphila]
MSLGEHPALLMDQNPFIVIMAGGVGTRFWPYSRVKKPKQFLDVLGTGKTLLQMTYERFLPLTSPDRIFVVTNKKYRKFVFEQLPALPQAHVLAEPLRRNTATCVAYACYKIRRIDPEAKLIVTPSDHLILKEEQFQKVMQDALVACASRENRLLTIGIQPNRPETGFGYIQYIQKPDTSVFKVKTFTEKPDEQLAQAFIDSGDFVWNAGIFVWTVPSIIHAFEKHLPEVAEAFEEGEQYLDTEDETAFIKRAYSLVKNVSIDIGILEKATNVYTLLADVAGLI